MRPALRGALLHQSPGNQPDPDGGITRYLQHYLAASRYRHTFSL
jgi:hypothetical protein